MIPLIYFLWSLKYGKPAGNNPWGAKGLEWDHAVAAADIQFRRDPDRHRRSLRIRKTRGGARWLIRTR